MQHGVLTRYPFDSGSAEDILMALRDDPQCSKIQGDFYTALRPMVLGAVNTFAQSADADTKEDLMQDAMVKIFGKVENFDPRRGSLHSWATQIIKNVCIDYFRRKKIQAFDPKDLILLSKAEPDAVFDTEFFTDLRAFFPFFCSTRVFALLYEALELSQFHVTNAVARRMEGIFRRNGIDPSSAGTPAEIAQFLAAMIRGWLYTNNEDQQDRVMENLNKYTRLDPLRALRHYIGAHRTGLVLFLLGGMKVHFPTAQEILDAAGPDFR